MRNPTACFSEIYSYTSYTHSYPIVLRRRSNILQAFWRLFSCWKNSKSLQVRRPRHLKRTPTSSVLIPMEWRKAENLVVDIASAEWPWGDARNGDPGYVSSYGDVRENRLPPIRWFETAIHWVQVPATHMGTEALGLSKDSSIEEKRRSFCRSKSYDWAILKSTSRLDYSSDLFGVIQHV